LIPIDIQSNKLFYYFNTRQYNHELDSNVTTIRLQDNSITLQKFISTKQSIFGNIFKEITVIDKQFLINNTYSSIKICSDGGSKNNKGSFRIIMQGNSNTLLTISSRIPCIYDKSNSHRSECYGLFMSIQVIIAIYQYMELLKISICTHNIELFCYNKSAVDTIKILRNKKLSLKQHGAPNMDIIKGILWGIKYIHQKKAE
jgi:hypothetical protein